MNAPPPTPPTEAIDLAPATGGADESPSGGRRPRVWIGPAGLRYSFSRASGPGGQAVNKLSTRGELRVALKDIVGLDEPARARLRRLAGRRLTRDDKLILKVETHRSQLDNRREAIERLRTLVTRAATAPKPRKPTRPSPAAVKRRLEDKREQARKKERRRSKRMEEEP